MADILEDRDSITENVDIMLRWDSGDPFGSCMSVWFDCAEYLFFELGADVPHHWDFSPSAIQTEIDPDNMFAGYDEPLTVGDLESIGNDCAVIYERCKAQGLDY